MDSLAITAEELAQVTGMSTREPPFPPVGASWIGSPTGHGAYRLGNPMVATPMVGNPMPVATPIAADCSDSASGSFRPTPAGQDSRLIL